MPLRDPRKAALVALWSAKSTFSTLASLRAFFGNDLDLAKVAFTLALRTRPDFLTEPEEDFIKISGQPEYFLSKNLSATIYEISKYSAMDRATVRRKLKKLEELGFADRTEDGQWTLINFLKDDRGPAAQALSSLFRGYLEQTAELFKIITLDEMYKIQSNFHDVHEIKSVALSLDEVRAKVKREHS